MGSPFVNGQMPQSQDPRSQYLARALSSMQAQPQTSMGGLGMNLLAEALLQHAQAAQRDKVSPQVGEGHPATFNIQGGQLPGMNPNPVPGSIYGAPKPNIYTQGQTNPPGLLGLGMSGG